MINKDLKTIIIFGTVITVVLSVVCGAFSPICGLICLALGVILTSVFFVCTKKRYKRLNDLNDYLHMVCAGNYDLDIADNSEGELSILKNNLYKVISILRTQNEMLKKDKLYLANSLADISHQLKTPLTSMMVMSDLLKTETSEEKRTEFVSVIENQLDKMKWLITNLLKMSKLDAGTVILKRDENSSTDIINTAVKPFALTLELKKITFKNEVDDFTLNVDKNWTVEAIQNIIKNCIEHTSQSGTITVSGKSTNIYDSIIIRDTGCGIAEKDLPHIFDRFYHGKNSSPESVGIGLALAKSVFEKENAEITVKSEEGKGTEFTVKFYKCIV